MFYLQPGTSQTGPAMSSTFVGATGSGAIAPFTIPIGGTSNPVYAVSSLQDKDEKKKHKKIPLLSRTPLSNKKWVRKVNEALTPSGARVSQRIGSVTPKGASVPDLVPDSDSGNYNWAEKSFDEPNVPTTGKLSSTAVKPSFDVTGAPNPVAQWQFGRNKTVKVSPPKPVSANTSTVSPSPQLGKDSDLVAPKPNLFSRVVNKFKPKTNPVLQSSPPTGLT